MQQAQTDGNTRDPARTAQQAAGNQMSRADPFMASDNNRNMPDVVHRQYLDVGKGRYHFKRSPDHLAFIDKGNKLETPSDGQMVAQTLVRVARQRGWEKIRVTGSKEFCREVWCEAALRGMTVLGYTPTETDKAQLQEMQAARRAHAYLTQAPEKAMSQAPELAGAFAARAAIREHLKSTRLTEQEQATILRQVDERMRDDLRKGHLPQLRKDALMQKEKEREKEEEMER